MEIVQKGEIPFVRLLIPLIAGISLAVILPTPGRTEFAYATLFSVFVLYFLFIVFYRRFNLYRFRPLGGTFVFLIISISAYILTLNKSQKLDPTHFSRSGGDFLLGIIQSEPKVSHNILRFEAKVVQTVDSSGSRATSGNILVTVKLNEVDQEPFRYGDLFLIPSKFTEVEGPHNPFEFDFKSYLANKALYHQVFVNEARIKLLKRDQGNPFMAYAISIRKRLVERYTCFISDRDAAAVASTLILGYRADLSKDVQAAYSNTGTTHVLSVSGMHVGIIYLVIEFLFRRMGNSKRLRFIRPVLILSLIWIYSAVTGFSPAVCRAAMMISFIIIGKAINRNQNTYNLVAVSAVLLLIYNPFFLLDVGFELSYLAVLGLVYVYPKIYHAGYVKNWIGDKLWSYTAISLSAQLATFPVSIYYFHQFPVYFLIGNLFIILPVAFIMYVGILFILIPVDAVSVFLGRVLEVSISLMNRVLYLIESLPNSSLSGIWIRPWEYLAIYLLIFLVILAFALKQKKVFITALLIVAGLALSDSLKKVYRLQYNEVIFYSLRKNTAIGFFEGRKAHVLTDLSPSEKTYSFSIKPSLEAMRVSETAVVPLDSRIEQQHLLCDDSFIQFRNWRMMIFDRKKPYKQVDNPVSVNAVLIRNNALPGFFAITNAVRFEIMILDGNNSDYTIKRWKEEARKFNFQCYVLKKEQAFIVKL